MKFNLVAWNEMKEIVALEVNANSTAPHYEIKRLKPIPNYQMA